MWEFFKRVGRKLKNIIIGVFNFIVFLINRLSGGLAALILYPLKTLLFVGIGFLAIPIIALAIALTVLAIGWIIVPGMIIAKLMLSLIDPHDHLATKIGFSILSVLVGISAGIIVGIFATSALIAILPIVVVILVPVWLLASAAHLLVSVIYGPIRGLTQGFLPILKEIFTNFSVSTLPLNIFLNGGKVPGSSSSNIEGSPDSDEPANDMGGDMDSKVDPSLSPQETVKIVKIENILELLNDNPHSYLPEGPTLSEVSEAHKPTIKSSSPVNTGIFKASKPAMVEEGIGETLNQESSHQSGLN